MSSPSKRRAAKREWMHKQASEVNRLISASRADCKRQVDNLTRHVPRSRLVDRDDGKQDVVATIDRFPDPTSNGEFHRYVLPEPPSPMFALFSDAGRSSRLETIDFRATYHSVQRSGPQGDSILKWPVWEPVLDKQAQRDEGVVIHKLRIAQSHLHYVHGHSETLALIEECIGVLQSQRGDFVR